ncbi:hypothetical protein D3C75_775120 [compost metagenome]
MEYLQKKAQQARFLRRYGGDVQLRAVSGKTKAVARRSQPLTHTMRDTVTCRRRDEQLL